MNSKLIKQILISSILILLTFGISEFLTLLGVDDILSPYVGMLFVIGLLFGPYGSLVACIILFFMTFFYGSTFDMLYDILIDFVINFGISCLVYKIWYSGYKNDEITKPNLNNSKTIRYFIWTLLISALIYSILQGTFIQVSVNELDYVMSIIFMIYYFVNFINFGFIFGIIFIWIFKRNDFVATPKKSKKQVNNKLYKIVFILLLVSTAVSLMTVVLDLSNTIMFSAFLPSMIILYIYLTKPFSYDIKESEDDSIIKNISNIFILATLTVVILGIIIAFLGTHTSLINTSYFENELIITAPTLLISDVLILLFFIPGFYILKYIENKVIKPIVSFSEIEGYIKENERIEAEGLLNVYSDYIDEKTEIGKLARSYTNLINHNNDYISNIKEIEGEKERYKAELDIATKIQASNLPTKAIETDDFIVNGYSHPAKEVGGDFFDYYQLDDENLAIIIGDASGKGVPAALLSTITQSIIKQLLNTNQDPSEVLYSLNNQLCENNSETMFITLWLGIYNSNSKKLIFSNAGHNPPLIKDNNEYKYLNIENGIVLGLMEDFEFVNEEITLSEEVVIYTDGITDANNKDQEMYGEERLKNFFNEFKKDRDPIRPLLNDINNFTEDEVQFDDMTLAYIKVK